ncbi:MAG: hypothetical protein HC888_11135 [Candidatus Competibacteraceae bacterium]|nr:hypothetical protein [Candidatus Competibacteraceae bacterium]
MPNYYHELKEGKPKVPVDAGATAFPNVRVTFDGYTVSSFPQNKRKVASSVEITSGEQLTGLSPATIEKPFAKHWLTRASKPPIRHRQ